MSTAAALETHAIALVMPQHLVATHATRDLAHPTQGGFHETHDRDRGTPFRASVLIRVDENLGIVRDHKGVPSPPLTLAVAGGANDAGDERTGPSYPKMRASVGGS
jgi:hypothetical protein